MILFYQQSPYLTIERFSRQLRDKFTSLSCLSINGTIYYMQETDDDVSRSMSDTELPKDSQKN